MELALTPLDELCPACGNFVESLDEETGFCGDCNKLYGVGSVTVKDPTSSNHVSRVELWLLENATKIENVMQDFGVKARYAIKIVAAQNAVVCECCGEFIPHATPGRHFFCGKHPNCKS